MSVINGTITGCTLVSASMNGAGARKVYMITADFAAYTGASDTATITGVGAAISSRVANGKTLGLRWAAPAQPGADTAAQAVNFTGTAVAAATISSDDLTGQLSTGTSVATEVTTTTGVTTGVAVFVAVDES